MSTRTCPKCRGLMYLEPGEYEDDWACLNCGKRISLEEMEVIMEKQYEVEANSITQPEVASSSTRPPVPPKPSSLYQIKKYYDDNKEAILKDLELLGETAMRERWGISQATWKCRRKDGSMEGLAVRWGLLPGIGTKAQVKAFQKAVDEMQKAKEKPVSKNEIHGSEVNTPGSQPETPGLPFTPIVTATVAGGFTPSFTDGLPPFPEFDSSWPEMVQLRWLDVYRELARSK